jgi:prepilin-type N-terminal cleavage/methylation domain-containing protein
VKRSGFALIEVLVAVVILGLVVTMSLGIYFDRQKRLKHASENIIAYQAIANEAEVLRAIPESQLQDSDSFLSLYDNLGELDPGPLGTLQNVATLVDVEQLTPVVKEVTLTVMWNVEPPRRASMTIYRTSAADNWAYAEPEEGEDPLE